MKKIILLAMCMGVAVAANASYLYWQVNTTDSSDATTYMSGVGTEWNAARLVVVEADAETISAWNDGNRFSRISGSDVVSNTLLDDGSDLGPIIGYPTEAQYAANLGALSGSTYAYYVELINTAVSTSEVVYRSNAVAYGSLPAGSVVPDIDGITAIPAMATWHAGGYKAVPEPTSAILMLFGAAFLGLKRKNRSIA